MISLLRLVEALGLTDESDLILLEHQRDANLAIIQRETHRYFGPVASTTEYLVGNGTSRLYLREANGSITNVSEYSYPGATASVIAPTTGYLLRVDGTEAYLLRVGSSSVWTSGYEYAVAYLRGYAEDGLPEDIEDLLIEMIRMDVNSGGEEQMQSETYGGYSYTRFDATTLSDKHQDTLRKWTRPVFA